MFLRRVLTVLTIPLLMLMLASLRSAEGASRKTLRGTVESAGTGLARYKVSLYARYVSSQEGVRVLGSAIAGPGGKFEINYSLPDGQHPLLFVQARNGPAMLASAIGQSPVVGPVVVNERTTVATGLAFAQFVDGAEIAGNPVGMANAIHMAGNMVRPGTGTLAAVLQLPPNGSETSALRTFNSLTNIVAYCVATTAGCRQLFDATTPPGGPPPTTVLQAVANTAKYPWLNVNKLFALSLKKRLYAPALAQQPDAWTLFLKFTGAFSSRQDADNLMNGPGAFAIDEEGFLWVSNNYIPEPPLANACAGTRLLKFYPWGEKFPGSPYFGGGLSGSGWGITLSPKGGLWVSNFGFAAPKCPTPPANSVSLFGPNGKPLSPATGFTEGGIDYPQGTMSDREENIWIANCRADSVTVYPKGQQGKAFEIRIPPPGGATTTMKPFGLAIDDRGNSWVTGSLNSTLAVIGSNGKLIEVIPPQAAGGRTVLSRPMGVASDSRGNIWVANSDYIDLPCPPSLRPNLASGSAPSIALFLRHPNRQPYSGAPFTGGGLTIPWGIAIDGNDTVWVANFGFPFSRSGPRSALNRVSHFCGFDTSKCPPSKRGVGKAISPDGTGYTSDALTRNTGVAIDPSGNVWLANNWKKVPLPKNPGDNSIAVLVGAAAPVKTPLIGTPQSFDRR